MGGERLRLVFTNVDERDTSRAFSFEVFIDSTDRYPVRAAPPPSHGSHAPPSELRGSAGAARTSPRRPPPVARARPPLLTRPPHVPPPVEQCEPSVPSLPQRLERLNTNNDFGAFVRAMRAGFKELC